VWCTAQSDPFSQTGDHRLTILKRSALVTDVPTLLVATKAAR
jgi:hypothetical protein